MLSSSRDETARLWDWQTGKERLALRGHFGPLNSAAFSPDGTRVVTAGADGTVRIWSSDSGEVQVRFEEHRGAVFAAEFSPDGRYVASAGEDERILVWDPGEIRAFDFGQLQQQLAQRFSAAAGSASPPPSSSESAPIRSSEAVRVLAGHTAAVRSLAFQSHLGELQGTFLLSSGHDNTVRVWNLDAQPGAADAVRTLRGHGGWVRAAAFLPDVPGVASGGFDKQVKIWDVSRYEEVRELFDPAEHSALAAAALAPDGRRALTAG